VSYIPNTDADRAIMLERIGIGGVEELFRDVPERRRFPRLDLPAPLSELELMRELSAMAARNAAGHGVACFLGAGSYRHFVPAVVDAIVSRSEFATAYTPYQPEISQGTLQAIFEYQTMIARLTGMDAANASHYDGATATAEAVFMALNAGRRERKVVLLAPGLHPQYREVVRTYTQGMGLAFAGEDLLAEDIGAEAAGLAERCGPSTACVVVQSPDFLGRVLPPASLRALADAAHGAGALLVVAANPVALSLFEPPGGCGADVVAGEGQPLGSPPGFGGPYLGFFAFKREHIRRSSGRIAGETADGEGRRGYVFTLSTREQHIRREKATSNICSNESLVALAAAVHLAALGPRGLRRVAELCWHNAHYAAARIAELPGFAVWSRGFFHEFAVRCPVPPGRINERLRERGIIGGYDLGGAYPSLAGHALFCCTEVVTRDDIDGLVSALREASHA
jgi:glycine dehydrogenase subunit 1